ncbi:MAG: sugar phosphate isomerase/epimerase family protein [Sphaerochaetaceae bacterium]
MKPIVGINLPPVKTPEQLRSYLNQFQQDGFDLVEFSVDAFPLLIGGEICRPWMDIVLKELQQHPLSYSVHIGRGVDLRNSDWALHYKALLSSINIASEVGSNILVLHYEEQSKNSIIEKQFTQSHEKAAKYAESKGVVLAIENIEVEVVKPVVDLVKSIDHDYLKMTFDTGHAFLASRYYGFDFFEALKSVLPFLAHIHLSDNLGIFEELRITNRGAYDFLEMGYRRTFGRGDIHLPPYYGAIDYDHIFRMLKGYEGAYVCEYTAQDFIPLNKSIQHTVRSRIIKEQSL